MLSGPLKHHERTLLHLLCDCSCDCDRRKWKGEIISVLARPWYLLDKQGPPQLIEPGKSIQSAASAPQAQQDVSFE